MTKTSERLPTWYIWRHSSPDSQRRRTAPRTSMAASTENSPSSRSPQWIGEAAVSSFRSFTLTPG
jgi:hypothetical protein